MTFDISQLADLGWNAFFTAQLEPEDFDLTIPVRVMAVHRGAIDVAGPDLDTTIHTYMADKDDEETFATVGDWLLLDPESLRPQRLLKRTCLFKRKAAGAGRKLQLIAANVDTLFIVTSCNQDFNIARLERYLSWSQEAGVTPVIILTKVDLVADTKDYIEAIAKLMPGLAVEALDGRSPDSASRLSPWCARGQTVAFVGSSGVGKSTLINTLSGKADITSHIPTQGIREEDGKGRHTTRGRVLHRMPAGGLLLDTPGIRELQLTDVTSGFDEVFTDIATLAESCHFSSCQHDSEPKCAVKKAITSGGLDAKRLKRWRKLVAEEAHNTGSLAERRSRDKAFGKMVKRVSKDKKRWQDD